MQKMKFTCDCEIQISSKMNSAAFAFHLFGIFFCKQVRIILISEFKKFLIVIFALLDRKSLT